MERVPPEEYDRAFGAFDAADYDPRAWARMARQAGMKYAVLTAKHHEGFCLFDSAYTDYKATNTPAGRDLVREYLEAFRAEGLRVGFYYSLVDCVSKGGTYLLNVGPNAQGALPAPAQEILREIGAWMRCNGESIYGCGAADQAVSAFGCRATAKGKTVYLHVMQQPVSPLAFGESPRSRSAAPACCIPAARWRCCKRAGPQRITRGTLF